MGGLGLGAGSLTTRPNPPRCRAQGAGPRGGEETGDLGHRRGRDHLEGSPRDRTSGPVQPGAQMGKPRLGDGPTAATRQNGGQSPPETTSLLLPGPEPLESLLRRDQGQEQGPWRRGQAGGGLRPPYDGCEARAVVRSAHRSLSRGFSGSGTSSAGTQTSLWAPNPITWGPGAQGDPTKNNACVGRRSLSSSGVQGADAAWLRSCGQGQARPQAPRHGWGSRRRWSEGQRGTEPRGLCRPCLARTEPRALLLPPGALCALSCSAGVTAAPHWRQKK